MDYVAVFRPILAYTAHLTAAAHDHGRFPSRTLSRQRDLRELVGAARQARNDPFDLNFDQAWFALACWFRRSVSSLPDGHSLVACLGESDDCGAEEFSRRLTLLLTPIAGGYPGDILDIIAVYDLCLDAAGRDGLPPALSALRGRCREALKSRRPATVPAGAPARPPSRLAAALIWLVPPLVPLCLWGIFRYCLDALYTDALW